MRCLARRKPGREYRSEYAGGLSPAAIRTSDWRRRHSEGLLLAPSRAATPRSDASAVEGEAVVRSRTTHFVLMSLKQVSALRGRGRQGPAYLTGYRSSAVIPPSCSPG